jgi:ribosomal protein S18 acetylase RimI-like enzyme
MAADHGYSPSSTEMEIRPPIQEESKAVHQLRMLGLQESPEAFGASYEESLSITEDSIATRYLPRGDHLTLCAFEDGTPIGMIGLSLNNRVKTKHAGNVVGMFVSPEHRGQGVANALVAALIDRAKKTPYLEQLSLEVATVCEPARRLYRKAGFTEIGVIPRVLRQGDAYHDIAVMHLDLGTVEP